LAEEGSEPPGIQPRGGAGLTDEGDGTAHAKLSVEGLEVAGEAGQGVEQVGHAHQVVIALHSVPIQGKGVLVVVALVLFHQEAGLDAPAVARAEVAAFVDVVSREGAAGEPGMASGLGDAPPRSPPPSSSRRPRHGGSGVGGPLG
jgi:hypothetical protein